MAIPVQNVYYLLCYAWNRLEARDRVDVGQLQGNRIENLLGKVLQVGVGHLIRRGLDRGYIRFEEEGRRLRGKVLISRTVQRSLLPQGQVACQVDDLSYDVPHNRVIKAAMRALIGVPGLDPRLRVGLRDHCRRLHDVADVDLSPSAFRQVQLHRNVARYAFLVKIAELVAESLIPDQKAGGRRFHPFTDDQKQMARLFEDFVRNFLGQEQKVFRVSRPKVAWDLELLPQSDVGWLPEMRTDVVLRNATSRVIIEAKYYADPFPVRYGTQKLRSGHLYQLLTYLSHMAATAGPKPVGVLLYAGVGGEQRFDYRLGDHTVLIRSLDLNQDWSGIHRDLCGLAAELASHRETAEKHGHSAH